MLYITGWYVIQLIVFQQACYLFGRLKEVGTVNELPADTKSTLFVVLGALFRITDSSDDAYWIDLLRRTYMS